MDTRPTPLEELLMAARSWNHSLVGDGGASFRLSRAIANYQPQTAARRAHDAIVELMTETGQDWFEVSTSLVDMAELGMLDEVAK